MGNLLGKLKGRAVTEAVSAVADVVDKFVANPAEKEAARAAIESEISKRWSADMDADSWLSKNIRPLTLASVMARACSFINAVESVSARTAATADP